MQVVLKRLPERGLLQLLQDLRVSLRAGAALAARLLVVALVVLLGTLRLERRRPGAGGQLQPYRKAEQVDSHLPPETHTHTQQKGPSQRGWAQAGVWVQVLL